MIQLLTKNRGPVCLEDVRPSEGETQRILERSYNIWSSYTKDANLEFGLPLECVQLQSMLRKVPSFPTSHINLKLERSESRNDRSELFISGVSTWETSDGQCDLEPRILRHQLLLGTQRITTCYFSEDSRFIDWPGIQNSRDQPVGGNYLAVLTFAWAYILSARWIEMQNPESLERGQTARCIHYLQAQADLAWDDDEALSHDITIDIGDVRNDAARWWTAILAHGEGWSATITWDGTSYRSPWSYHLKATQNFRLRRNKNCRASPSGVVTPPSLDDMPSSRLAMGFLAHFCLLHNIQGQCSAALAAGLLFPCLRNSMAKLPFPKPRSGASAGLNFCNQAVPSATRTEVVFQESNLIPYYMALSCNPYAMRSLLCGAFFDPEICCNQVSAWLQSAFDVIDPIVKRSDYEMLAIVMGKRQPRIAGLWLGAVITGMDKSLLQCSGRNVGRGPSCCCLDWNSPFVH